ncbi:MAG: prepilin-type N-terminal cleavage/methylation domain-containing protein [Patescibacteria group bacterium]
MKQFSNGAMGRCKKGFTLIELMIAATLIMMVFGSIFALVNYGIYALSYIRNNLTASFLAQEGVELVIKKRTENWLKGQRFNYQLTNGSYQVDYLGSFTRASGEPLKFNFVRGYQYSSGESSNFTRTITLQRIDSTHLRVLSEVVWRTKDNQFSVLVEDHLYDWFGVPAE